MDLIQQLFIILETARQGADSSIFWSFVAGALYGLTCIQCVLPVAIYGSAEGDTKRGGLFAIYFNLPRLLLFLILGLIAAGFSSIFLSFGKGGLPSDVLMIFHVFTGLVLIFFSAELFGLFSFDKLIVEKIMNKFTDVLEKDFSTHWYGALLRGFLFSIACCIESVALVFAIWFVGLSSSLALQNPWFAFFAVFAYGIGNVASTTLAAALLGGSTGFLEARTKLDIRRYVSILGSLLLLFLGLNFLVSGIIPLI